MGRNITVTGMVLNAMPIGDYDKRITLLTRERGKITAFARGARKPNNQNLAACNPFVFGEFEVYEGRSTYTLYRSEVSNYFRELTADLECVCVASYFAEVAEYYSQENMDEKDRLNLLYVSLRALEEKQISLQLIQNIYEWKNMIINGEYPDVFSCFSCGQKEHLTHFSMKHRSMVCSECESEIGGTPISQTLLYTLQYVSSATMQKLYSFRLTSEVEAEFTSLMHRYKTAYQEHTFKSESFLNVL